MKEIIFILLLILANTSTYIDTSYDIWNRAKGKINEKNYFIYDDNNYLNQDVNPEKMKSLSSKQASLYNKHNKLLNYIIIIKYLNTYYESYETCTTNLVDYISRDYNLDKDNCILALIMMDNGRVEIYSGKDKYSKSDRETMVSHIKNYLSNQQFYDALNKLLDDFDTYYQKGTPSWVIPVVVVSCIVGVVVIGVLCSVCCPKSKGNGTMYNTDSGYYDSGYSGGDYGGGDCGGGGDCAGGDF